MSFIDAAEIRERSQAIYFKANEFHTKALELLDMADQIKDIVNSLGTGAPPVSTLVTLAIDNLGTANHQIGQVSDLIEDWAKKL